MRRRAALVLAALAALAGATEAAAAATPRPSFRAQCLFSHRLADDPIVRPGLPGAAHSHDFFGNRSTDARSTPRSLRSGRTSCEPEEDRAAYWVPTLYDTGGRPVTALSATFYYVASTRPARRVRPYPFGLTMLAGDPMAHRRHPNRAARWRCTGTEAAAEMTIRRCPAGTRLVLDLRFPDCWNGRDLDSRDHRRHMAYSVDGRCPRSRPLAVPELRYEIAYPTRGAAGMRLSSGSGYTLHGDFVNAWEPEALRLRVRECLRRGVACDPYGLPE